MLLPSGRSVEPALRPEQRAAALPAGASQGDALGPRRCPSRCRGLMLRYPEGQNPNFELQSHRGSFPLKIISPGVESPGVRGIRRKPESSFNLRFRIQMLNLDWVCLF